MDYQNKQSKIPNYTCFCERKYKEGEDPIYKMKPQLKKVKEKINYRKYPSPEKIIDFNFKAGGDVAMGDKEKKPPKSGKIKMKTYGEMDAWTKL